MILNKKTLNEYLDADKTALNKCDYSHPRPFLDVIWKYQILLRKCEYYENCRHDILGKVVGKFFKLRFILLSQRLGFSIPLNVFGKGLSIAHYGSIVVNANAKIGDYCRIHEGVTIGVSGEDYWGDQKGKAPVIGNSVFLATGAKIIGRVHIADNVAIGANAVVVKDINEANSTWGGVPARKIGDKGSAEYVRRMENDNQTIFETDLSSN